MDSPLNHASTDDAPHPNVPAPRSRRHVLWIALGLLAVILIVAVVYVLTTGQAAAPAPTAT